MQDILLSLILFAFHIIREHWQEEADAKKTLDILKLP